MQPTADVVPDRRGPPAVLGAPEPDGLDERGGDAQVVHRNGSDPRCHADEGVLLVIQGHVRDPDSAWGNAAEHGRVAFPQHPLEGEHLRPVRRLSSCVSQSNVHVQHLRKELNEKQKKKNSTQQFHSTFLKKTKKNHALAYSCISSPEVVFQLLQELWTV